MSLALSEAQPSHSHQCAADTAQVRQFAGFRAKHKSWLQRPSRPCWIHILALFACSDRSMANSAGLLARSWTVQARNAGGPYLASREVHQDPATLLGAADVSLGHIAVGNALLCNAFDSCCDVMHHLPCRQPRCKCRCSTTTGSKRKASRPHWHVHRIQEQESALRVLTCMSMCLQGRGRG